MTGDAAHRTSIGAFFIPAR